MKKWMFILLATCLHASCHLENKALVILDDDAILRKCFAGPTNNIVVNINSYLQDYIEYYYNRSEKIKNTPIFIAEKKAIVEENNYYINMTSNIFNILRRDYISYFYFGGDKVFMSAYLDLIERIGGYDTKISDSKFVMLLSETLSKIIKDGHFLINDTSLLNPDLQYYWNRELYFYPLCGNKWAIKNESGFFEIIDFGKNIQKEYSLVPTICEDGSIAWISCVRSNARPSSKDVPIKINGRKKIIVLGYSLMYYSKIERPLVSYTSSGIPILFFDQMIEEREDCFIKTAREVKSKNVIIIDLTMNPGGLSRIVEDWVSVYFDSTTPVGFLYTVFEPGGMVEPKTFKDILMRKLNAKHQEYNLYNISYKMKLIDDERLHFVCISPKTASAAELLVSAMKGSENTICVGIPSSGAIMHDSGFIGYFGKNREIKINIPLARNYLLQNIQELQGIIPDFYVNPTRAAEYVDMFIQHYGINKIKHIFDELYRIKTPYLHNLMVE